MSGRKTRAQAVWQGIRQRCSNPKFRQWKDYGGRGIEVRFKSFDEFLSEVGDPPPGRSIDRIDNDGHYESGNVRWATPAQQQRNRRGAVFVEIGGKRYRAMDLAKQSGHKTDVIVARARRGLSLRKVLSPGKFHNLSGLALGGQASGARKRERTRCIKGHAFTPENSYITPQGWRNCRECHRQKMRRRNAIGG
jgi:hypothetical protein